MWANMYTRKTRFRQVSRADTISRAASIYILLFVMVPHIHGLDWKAQKAEVAGKKSSSYQHSYPRERDDSMLASIAVDSGLYDCYLFYAQSQA